MSASSAPAPGAAQSLTDRYEELRAVALGRAAASHARGLALVLRGGMVAWMRAWLATLAPDRAAHESPCAHNRAAVDHGGAQPELIAMLTQMAIAAAEATR